jgi:hypothetical protein
MYSSNNNSKVPDLWQNISTNSGVYEWWVNFRRYSSAMAIKIFLRALTVSESKGS